MKINPVFKKEIIATSRSVRLSFVILVLNALLGLCVIAMLVELSYGLPASNSINAYVDYFQEIMSLCGFILIGEFAVLFMFVPVYTASSIAEEREKQTFEMLITTEYSPMKIVIGKLLSGLASILIILVSTLPMIMIMFAFYPVKVKYILTLALLFVLLGAYIGSIGMCAGARTESSKAAAILGFIWLIILVGGTFLLVYVVYMLKDGIVNYNYYIKNDISYISVEPGFIKYILLFNPAVTACAAITKILGIYSTFKTTMGDLIPNGNFSKFTFDNWYIISTLLQSGVIVLSVWWTSKRINPLHKKRKYLKTFEKNNVENETTIEENRE